MNAPASPEKPSTALEPGSTVGGRFVVEKTASEDALGVVLAARDSKTQKPIALRVLPKGRLDAEGAKGLRTECRIAAGLNHRNVVATYGVGNDPGGGQFIACEWVDGIPLSKLIDQRAAKGGQMSLRGAYNVIAHVCKALTYAHQKTCHGGLRPSVVWVSKSGRVKVGDFGVSKSVIAASGAGALGDEEQACLAPEVKSGGIADEKSDIFGVGALLYELLTNLSPADGFTPPSQAHPHANEDIDQVLLKCLAADPEARFATPADVQKALLPLVAEAPEGDATDDFGFEIDVDVELASIRPPKPPPPSAAKARGPKPPAPKPPGPRPAPQPMLQKPPSPAVGARVSIHEEFRAPADAAVASVPGSAVDLGNLLQKITENDAARWMVEKDGLDHGPFTARELVELIVKDDIHQTHKVANMETGERKNVLDWPEFAEFLEQQKVTREHKAEKVALAEAVKSDQRSGVAKVVMAGGLVGVIALAFAVFWMTRQAGPTEAVATAAASELYESGEIEIEGSAGILPDPPRRRGRRGGSKRGGGGGGGGGGSSYEDAMNRAVELGDVTSGGSETRLTPAQVTGVMNRNINRIYRACVIPEVNRGGNLAQVHIDIAIAGSGSVIGASARQGSSSFQSCINRSVRNIRFPGFGAPRMGARYRFAVD